MAHLDLFQTGNLLSQNAQASGHQWRRQLAGAALLLAVGAGYALYHADVRPTPIERDIVMAHRHV